MLWPGPSSVLSVIKAKSIASARSIAAFARANTASACASTASIIVRNAARPATSALWTAVTVEPSRVEIRLDVDGRLIAAVTGAVGCVACAAGLAEPGLSSLQSAAAGVLREAFTLSEGIMPLTRSEEHTSELQSHV